MSVNVKKMTDPQIGPDPSAGSSPAFIRVRLAVASSYVKKRLYFSLLICDPNPPRHPFFPYKTKKDRIAAIHHLLVEMRGVEPLSKKPVP